MSKTKQISIVLPEAVVKRAEKVAKSTKRSDGLKQTATATLRAWILKGMNTDDSASACNR